MFHDAPVEPAVTVHRKPRRDLVAPSSSSSTAMPTTSRTAQQYQLSRVVGFVLRSQPPFLRVALQFPDELLEDAVEVEQCVEQLLCSHADFPLFQERLTARIQNKDATSPCGCASQTTTATTTTTAAAAAAHALTNPNSPSTTRFVVLSDNTFGSCCPDEITAQHYQCDAIVHFGDACMSRSSRLPILYVQPLFRFACVAPTCAPDDAHANAIEVRLVVDVVQRMVAGLERKWKASDQSVVVPRLVVVGTHATKALLQAAQASYKASRTAAPLTTEVDWSSFLPSGNPAPSPSCSATAHGGVKEEQSAPVAVTETATVPSPTWCVNGVGLPRLPTEAEVSASATTPSMVVQYFLFIGPAQAPQLVHLCAVLAYNQHHSSEAAREFIADTPAGVEEDSVPSELSVLDETFGSELTSENAEPGRQGSSDDQAPGSCTAAPLSADASSEEVHAFVDRVFETQGSGVRGLYSAACVQAHLQLQRRLRQRSFNIETIRASGAVGIVVASLAIAGYKEVTQLLHRLLRLYNKRAYIIYIGHLNEFKLANFVDTVDCFAVVACPNSRVSHYPEKADGYLKPVVSPVEVLLALTTGEEAGSALYGLPAAYSTAFDVVIEPLRRAVAAKEAAVAAASTSAAAGHASSSSGGEGWADSAALIHAPAGALTAQGAEGSLARLYERTFVGLDPRLGETAVQTTLVEGKHGIARGYAAERDQQVTPDA